MSCVHLSLSFAFNTTNKFNVQKQPSRDAPSKRTYENVPQNYRRTIMLMCDLIKLLAMFIKITHR